jgi:hypothetical protein
MIVSASYKTDVPAFYGPWFRRRLAAGQARMVNPYGGQVHAVDLTPRADGGSCDGFVFWTKNAAPFADALAEVADRGLPFVVQYTITAYPRALETSVVDWRRAVADARAIAERYGPATLVWRYDPVLLTSLTPPDWHRDTFARLADALAGASDEVVLSFATVYAKTKRNTEAAAARHGFDLWDPPAEEKTALLEQLAGLAAARGLAPRLCAQPELRPDPLFGRLQAAACIDATRLSRVAGRDIAARTKGNRPGCLCAQARDIGAYDTCPHGCCYCYAVQRPELAKRRHQAHDPDSPFLLAPNPPSPHRGRGPG